MNSILFSKVISGLLVLALVFTLVGCGESRKEPQETTAAQEAPSEIKVENEPEKTGGEVESNETIGFTQAQVIDKLPLEVADYSDFMANAKPDFLMPGLEADIVPQGLAILPDGEHAAISAYRETKDNSVIFIVDTETKALVKSILLVGVDGRPYTGHAGGLAASEDMLFVASGEKILTIPLETLTSADDMAEVQFTNSYSVGTRASLANYSGGVLWVGDFFYPGGNYNTKDSHKTEAPDGTTHYAWMEGFKLDIPIGEKSVTATGELIPDYIVSMTERIQGVAQLDSGEFVLSQSYGRKNKSSLLIHSNILETDPVSYYDVEGELVPMWYLDNTNLEQEIIMPPMSEGIDSLGDSVYILYESGANKYRGNGVDPIDHIFKWEKP